MLIYGYLYVNIGYPADGLSHRATFQVAPFRGSELRPAQLRAGEKGKKQVKNLLPAPRRVMATIWLGIITQIAATMATSSPVAKQNPTRTR